MYFYDQKSVKARFLTTGFSERESLPYIVAYVVLASLGYYIGNDSDNLWDYLTCASSVIAAIGSTILFYKANGGSSGSQFIVKYVILGWVLSIRALTILLPAVVLLYVLGYFWGLASEEEETSPFDFGCGLLLEIFLYGYIYHHFADLRKSELAALPPPIAA